MFEINDLYVKLANEDKELLHGTTLRVNPGEIHAVMGPNGSGKSTLTHAVMGNPNYEITSGKILVDGTEIQNMPTHERARNGIFATMQYPVEVPGVPVATLMGAVYGDVSEQIDSEAKELELEESFLQRGVNDEFSGGERKRMEALQLAVSNAKYAILDEIDSGLDVDALKIIAERINTLVQQRQLGVIAITHYDRLLKYLKPTHVHIFAQGKVVQSGGYELAEQLEKQGYENLINA